LYFYRFFRNFVRYDTELPVFGLFPYIQSLALGYLIGSIPTAFVFVSWKKRIDIRKSGSGNVGAMNTYDITGSVALGALVMVLDILKGMAAVGAAPMLFGGGVPSAGFGGIGAVLGHDYPVWLRFKGGRGLSTTAGVMLLMGWLFVAVWCTLWTVIYIVRRDIHRSNVASSCLTPAVLAVLPAPMIAATLPSFMGRTEFLYLAVVLSLCIIIRHMDHVRDFFKKQQS
jgi:glycerol-3-phosphate acyltransferase PlsY